MKYLKYQFIVFLLLLSFPCIAQENKSVQIGGNVSGNAKVIGTQTNVTYYIDSSRTVIQIDTLALTAIVRREITMATDAFKAEKKSLEEEIKELKNNNGSNIEKIQNLEEEVRAYEGVISFLKKRQAEVEAKRWNYLPFGVHQFATKQTGKGILFAGTQVGLSLGGIYLLNGYQKTYDTYSNEPYQSEVRHNNLRNCYRWQFAGAMTCFAGATISLILNYCDNFKKHNENVSFAPIVMPDWQGKPQMAMNLSINF